MIASRRHILAVLLLLGVVILAYAASLRNGFIWDDNFQIVRNPYIHGNQPLTKLLFSDVWGYIRAGEESLSNYYRPLQMIAYRWTFALAGFQPRAFHALSILLNFLACLGAYGVFWQLTKRFSLGVSAAVIFALHPIHTEAVLWIAALPELGCALFFFLSFWFFLRAQPPEIDARKPKPKEIARQNTRRHWMLAASCACAFVALLWKEMAFSLPLVIAAYAFLLQPPQISWKARALAGLKKSAPFWAVVAAYSAVRIAVLGHFSTVQNPWSLSAVEYAMNVVELIGEYWLRLLLPLKLNAYHVFHAVVSAGDARWIAALLFLCAAIVGIVYATSRSPQMAFAGAWTLLTLIPVLNLRAVGTDVFAERYLFIPSLGFTLLLVLAGAQALARFTPAMRRNIGIAVVVLIAGASTAQIWHRVPAWHDEYAFLTNTIAGSPDAAQMRNSLGQLLRERGDVRGAETQYREALQAALAQHTDAQVATAYLGLASVAWQRQQFDEALRLVDQGLTYRDLESLHVSRGILLLQLGRAAEGKQVLEQVVRFFPYDEVALNALGVIALAEHNTTTAIGYFEHAVTAVPSFAEGYNNLGRTYLESGQAAQAAEAFAHATSLQPANSLFRTNYAVALIQSGDMQQAREQLQAVLQRDPNNGYAAGLLNRINQTQPAR